jgi:ATP/maltotriose-dependent transcriptional regulator MalT
MRQAINWSFKSLSPAAKSLFSQLSVFAGDFSLEAMEAVFIPNGGSDERLVTLLPALVDSNLIQVQRGVSGLVRYRLLETVRQFAVETFADSGLQDQVVTRYIRYYLALAEQAEPNAMFLPDAAWLNNVSEEHTNVFASFERACRRGDGDSAVRFVAACGPFWANQGFIHQGREWSQRALALGGNSISHSLTIAQHWAGQLAMAARDYPAMLELGKRELTSARALNDPHVVASALHTLALYHQHQMEWDQADGLFDAQIEIWRELGSDRFVSWALVLQGGNAYGRRDFKRARAMIEQALRFFERDGDARQVAATKLSSAMIALAQGHFEDAASLNLEGMSEFLRTGDRHRALKPLIGMAAIGTEYGLGREAARLLGAADELCSYVDSPPGPFDQEIQVRTADQLCRLLGLEVYVQEHATGREMEPDAWLTQVQAINALVAQAGGPEQTRRAAELGITRRMYDVLRLLARNMTDQEIATELFISVRTVNTHVANLRSVLNVGNRREVVKIAKSMGLLSNSVN